MKARMPVGIGLVVAGTVAALVGLAPMVEVGTCASGGPYVIENECPDAYEWLFWVIFGGVLVAIAGILLVFFTAGEPLGFAVLSVWFLVLGVAALLKARGLEGDSRLGLDIVGWIFVPMGIGGLFMARGMHRAALRHR